MSDSDLVANKLVTFHPYGGYANPDLFLAVISGDDGNGPQVKLVEKSAFPLQPWLMILALPDPPLKFSKGEPNTVCYITNQFYDSGRLPDFYGHSLGDDAGRAAVWPSGSWKTFPWRLHHGGSGSSGGQATRGWMLENMWRQNANQDPAGTFLGWRRAPPNHLEVSKRIDTKNKNNNDTDTDKVIWRWEIRSWPDGGRIAWEL